MKVELPTWRFSWESYHSEENKGGNPDYPAPSLVDYLGMRKIGAAVDLVEMSGRLAMVFRDSNDRVNGFRSRLLYLRADLLKKYLGRIGRSLVWINWGERSLDHTILEQLRDDPAMRMVWDRHSHIHKQFRIYGEAGYS